MNKNKGFTLVEMVVVLAVVAILAAILTPTIAKNINDAKLARATNEAQVIGAAMASFFKDTGRWPTKDDAVSTADVFWLLYGDGGSGDTATNWSSGGPWAATADTFTNHLVRNTPGGAAAAANQYPVTGELRWRGPYITEIKADPWGTHYSCNVASLWEATQQNFATFILSAGPNRVQETSTSQDITTTSPATGGDDIGFRLK